MDNIIAIRHVNKTFGGKKALDGINLDINNREMTALLGPSGSGKSTLLRHLSGLVVSDNNPQSSISVLGKVVQSKGRPSKEVRTCRAQAGYVFQQFNLVNRLSVLTNVLVGALSSTAKWRTLTGTFTAEQRSRALKALDRVGMGQYAMQRVSTLSGGQQQRVAIARALMQEAKIIFADEPIASLDPESSRIVMELLAAINKQEGIPVIVTLHQVDHALKYCSQIVALRDGKVFYQGASEGLSEQKLAELYDVKPQSLPTVTLQPELAPSFS